MPNDAWIGCGICGVVCYAIGFTIGVVFSNVVPHNELDLAAVIVTTLPVFAVLGAGFLHIFFGWCHEGCIVCAAFTSFVLSGIFDLAGVGLFIAAMVQAASELDSPTGAITCGVFASIFLLAAAIINFTTICCLIAGRNTYY